MLEEERQYRQLVPDERVEVNLQAVHVAMRLEGRVKIALPLTVSPLKNPQTVLPPFRVDGVFLNRRSIRLDESEAVLRVLAHQSFDQVARAGAFLIFLRQHDPD